MQNVLFISRVHTLADLLSELNFRKFRSIVNPCHSNYIKQNREIIERYGIKYYYFQIIKDQPFDQD